jgi:hypothetical protein
VLELQHGGAAGDPSDLLECSAHIALVGDAWKESEAQRHVEGVVGEGQRLGRTDAKVCTCAGSRELVPCLGQHVR